MKYDFNRTMANEIAEFQKREIEEITSECYKLKAQRDALLKELARVVQFFGPDEEKGLLPDGFATFNGARAAIEKTVEDK